MKKILFPTDFSEASENTYKYALHLANQFGASITTIHTFMTPVVMEAPAMATIQLREIQEDLAFQNYHDYVSKLHDIARQLNLEHIQVDHRLEYGYVIEGVLRVSYEENFDLIVMGTRGAEGWEKIFIGTNAASVASKAECPVLIVPEDADYHSIKKVMYATNFDELEKRAIDSVLEWGKLLDANLDFVHVSFSGEYIDSDQFLKLHDFKTLAGQHDHIQFKVLKNENVLKGLEDYVEDKDVDVLAMFTHHYSFFKRLFRPSLTKKMAFETKVPLLVFSN